MDTLDYNADGSVGPRPKLPTPGRVHPKDGGLNHLVTTVYHKSTKDGIKRVTLRGIKGDDRPLKSWGLTPIKVVDEYIGKDVRLVGSRSKSAAHGSSSKTQRFVLTNRQVDRTIDTAPTETVHVPVKWSPVKRQRMAR